MRINLWLITAASSDQTRYFLEIICVLKIREFILLTQLMYIGWQFSPLDWNNLNFVPIIFFSFALRIRLPHLFLLFFSWNMISLIIRLIHLLLLLMWPWFYTKFSSHWNLSFHFQIMNFINRCVVWFSWDCSFMLRSFSNRSYIVLFLLAFLLSCWSLKCKLHNQWIEQASDSNKEAVIKALLGSKEAMVGIRYHIRLMGEAAGVPVS